MIERIVWGAKRGTMFNDDESIETEENIFDINEVLDDLYLAVKDLSNERGIELIYQMGANTPRKMRGDASTLLTLLTKVLRFIFQHTEKEEIILSLSSPEDFLYEEFVSFEILDTQVANENIFLLLKTDLKQEIASLEVEVVSQDESSTDIHLRVPFKNYELGFRRHYRLPYKEIVGKKVLLLCANKKTGESIQKMFAYFHYTVDMEINQLLTETIESYDLIIVSEKVPKEVIKKAMYHIQRTPTLKYIILQEPKKEQPEVTDIQHFTKPITQQKIYDLIVSIFKDDLQTEKLAVTKEMEGTDGL
jgi:hypothetical protein